MPTQDYLYLEITDTVTSVLIARGTLGDPGDYQLRRNEWAPALPALREGQMGGRGPFEDVVEEIPIRVKGATAALAMANLAALYRLLLQAKRWKKGEAVRPVLVKYVPQGSTLHSLASPLQAVILGRASGDETDGANLDKTFHMSGEDYVIDPVRLRFTRRAFVAESETATSASTPSGDPIQCVFASSAADMSPLKVSVDNLTPGAALDISSSFLFVARNQSGVSGLAGAYLKSYSASGMAATGWAAFAETATLPRNGASVLRYTPPNTAFNVSGALALDSPITKTRRVYVYATVRNNSTTRNYTIYGEFVSISGVRAATSRKVKVAALDGQNPRAVFLGSVSLPVDEIAMPLASFPTFRLYASSDVTSGTGALDIDALIFVGLDDEAGKVVGLHAFNLPNAAGQDIVIDTRVLTRAAPTATLERQSPDYTDMLGYDDDLWLSTVGDRVTLLWLVTRSTFWRMADSAGALLNFTFTAVRQSAYLTPQ